MLSDAQISRLLDVANAACHTGNVADARTIYERILKEEVLAVAPDDADALAVLGLCYTLAGRNDEAEAVLLPLAEGEGASAELAAGLLEKLRRDQ